MPDLHIDDPAAGPTRGTSHPDFVARCGADLYYDAADQRSPFGSPEGVEALRGAERWFLDGGEPARWSAHVLSTYADLVRIERRDAINVLKIADLRRYCAASGRDAPETPGDYDPVDELEIIARALSGLKIAGVFATEMRVATLAALDRIERGPAVDDPAWAPVVEQVRADLTD